MQGITEVSEELYEVGGLAQREWLLESYKDDVMLQVSILV